MAKYVTYIKVCETLKSLEIGEIIVFPFNKVLPNNVRANVCRLRKRGYDFNIEQSMKDSRTVVQRIK